MNLNPIPIISVVVPSYNKARFLPCTIDSVIKQTFQEWELIIVDDHSSDDSVDLIRKFAESDRRISFQLNDTNRGGNYCRNAGIDQARGEYLMFLDADDLLAEFCLAQRFSEIDKGGQFDFLIFPTGTFYKTIGDSNSVWRTSERINHLRQFMQHILPWNISSPLWRTSFVKKHGGFDEQMKWLQDVEFHTRMLMASGVRYKVVNNIPPDFFYRIDQERLVAGSFNYVKNYVYGQLSYIQKMLGIIAACDLPFKLNPRYLKGSLASAFQMVLYNASLKKISPVQSATLFSLIRSDQTVNTLLNKKDKVLIKGYQMLYAAGMNRIKGADTIFKYLLTL